MKHTLKRFGAVLLVLTLSFMMAAPALARDNDKQNKGKNELSANALFKGLLQKNDEKNDRNDKDERKAERQEARYVLINGEVTAISGVTMPAELTVKVTRSSPDLVDESTLLTVHVDNKSHFVRDLFGTSAFTELSIGDSVQVFGQLRTDGSLGATSVKDLSIKAENRSGTVEALNLTNQTFVLVGTDNTRTTVQANAQTEITNKDNVKLTLADLVAGTTVHIKGVLNTRTNVLTAQAIRAELEKPTPLPMSFRGELTALSSTTLPAMLTLRVTSVEPPMDQMRALTTDNPNDTVVVRVDANTVIRAHSGQIVRLNDLTIGDTITVQANVHSDGSLTATIVENHSLTSITAELRGMISSLNNNLRTFVLMGTSSTSTVQIGAYTTIAIDGVENKTWADLMAGHFVTVLGFLNNRTDIIFAEALRVLTP